MARILVVEDDPGIRQLVSLYLTGEGHEVGEARDGFEGLDLLFSATPDLLILDLMLPGRDGHEILRELREVRLGPMPKVLVITAKHGEEDWKTSFELGAAAHMTKPFDPQALVDKVHELLTMSEDTLDQVREDELDRASLLSQLETIFDAG